MNLDLLYEILAETTAEFRKGDVVEQETIDRPELVETPEGDPVGVAQTPVMNVTHVYLMPHEQEAPPGLEMIDVWFEQIGVDREQAQERRAELIEVLKGWPEPERLKLGPSYIEVGGVIGDQSAALRLFALGRVLEFWHIITPANFNVDGQMAKTMAGRGFIMITGFDPDEVV